MVSEANSNSPKRRRRAAAGDGAPPEASPPEAAASEGVASHGTAGSTPMASPSMPAGADAAGEGADEAGAALELVLVKDGRRFVFRYHRGEESQVLESIAGMARDPQSKLTLFDAAVLSHQMGQAMRKRLEMLLRA